MKLFSPRHLSPSQSGHSLVELLLGVALMTLLIPALMSGLFLAHHNKNRPQFRMQAAAWLQFASEGLRNVREQGWQQIPSSGTYHITHDDDTWQLVPGSETVNGLTRSIVVSEVRRDSSGVIVVSGGSVDPSTKRITLTVSWLFPFLSQASSEMYLTRHTYQTRTETTEAEFSAGTEDSVVVTNTDGGEVTLGAGGGSEWCTPNLSITPLDLPKNGVANAVTAIEGKAFAGTGDNASGVSYASIQINNNTPPSSSLISTFDGYKTNGVFGEQNYAYLATDNNTKEVVIIDIAQVPHVEVGSFNVPGSSSANSVAVSGSIGYALSGSTLYAFDLSSKNGSRSQLGSVTLAGTGQKVSVVGGYAYVVLASTPTQLQIVNVSNPQSPSLVASAQVSGGNGQDIFINSTGTRAYLVTAASTTQAELFIIDTSSKSGQQPTVSSYDTSGMSPKAVTVVPSNRVIVVGTGGEEYQVISAASETQLTRCGGLNVDTGISGIASVLESDGDAYSYIITGDSSSEFKMIEGGPGGQFSTTGSFESQTFDFGDEAAVNRISAIFTQPNLTTVSWQIGSAPPVNGVCPSTGYFFVGPDGSDQTYFTSAGLVPFNDDGSGYENPAQCFRYKVFLSTIESTVSPIVSEVLLNYSP